MKTTLILIGITISGIVPTLAQGYINFSWLGSGNPTAGVRIGSFSNPASQLPGWYVSGDYSVEAWMAAGPNQSEASLVPIASTKTVFIGGATTTAAGSPSSDGSGLWFAGVQDTGLAVGPATIEVKAWYDPNHNRTYDQALGLGVNTGRSTLYNITLVENTSPFIQSLDDINFQAFCVGGVGGECPEPSTFALAGLGAAVLIFRCRKQPIHSEMFPHLIRAIHRLVSNTWDCHDRI